MIASTPVEKIVEILEAAHYAQLSTPLTLAGLPFYVAAALVGTDKSQDLIIVADTAFETEANLLNNVENIARALDFSESKRPLTTVVAGPRPSNAALEAMARVSRVLTVGMEKDTSYADSLKNWLAVLLPLELPEPADLIADPYQEILTRSRSLGRDVRDLIDLAGRGAGAVETRLHKIISDSSPAIEPDDFA